MLLECIRICFDALLKARNKASRESSLGYADRVYSRVKGIIFKGSSFVP